MKKNLIKSNRSLKRVTLLTIRVNLPYKYKYRIFYMGLLLPYHLNYTPFTFTNFVFSHPSKIIIGSYLSSCLLIPKD